MKTLEEVKNEVAIDHGHKNFHYWGLSENGYRERSSAFDEIAKRYALEAIKADRERVKAMKEIDPVDGMETVAVYRIDNLPIELP